MSYDAFFSRTAEAMRESPIRKMGGVATRVPDLISFAPGYPDPATFPHDAFREIAADLFGGDDPHVLQYGATRGYRPLLEALDGVMRARGIASTFEERLITTGSQQGLDLVARVLLDPGDVVLVELPTYTGAIAAFQNARAELVGVPQESDGVDLQALDGTVQQLRSAGRRVKFLYVVPNFQNPTGLLIGLEKRRRLLEWSMSRDVLLVEDDPYGDLYFPDAATVAETRPIKADDAHGRVVYLSSFSKTLAPGFRVAWIVAPLAITSKLEIAKQAADICTGGLDQRVVFQAITRGVLGAQAERLRMHYQEKRTAMQQSLTRTLGDRISSTVPRGGFFLWVTLPARVDGERLLERALQDRVSFVVGQAFFVNGAGANTVRLSFSHPTVPQIVEGIARLARAIEGELATAQGVDDAAGTAGATSVLSGISAPRG
jgi:2-aminoadipate transaminase